MSAALQEHSEFSAAQQEVQVCCVFVSRGHFLAEALCCQAGAFSMC